jgi:hypothetical protein
MESVPDIGQSTTAGQELTSTHAHESIGPSFCTSAVQGVYVQNAGAAIANRDRRGGELTRADRRRSLVPTRIRLDKKHASPKCNPLVLRAGGQCGVGINASL